jgi:hypothetical protein
MYLSEYWFDIDDRKDAGVISSDVFLPNGMISAEFYLNTSNFYCQVCHLVIDLTQWTILSVAGMHWQVAQATSLQNTKVLMTKISVTMQVGIFKSGVPMLPLCFVLPKQTHY